MLTKREKLWLFSFLIFITTIFSFLSIRNHEQFQTFAWDLGFFDQLIWKANQFRYPYSTIGELTILGDHFQPVLYFLVPLYWLWSDVRIILIAQAVLVVFATIPLYLLARKVLQEKIAAWTIVFAFLFFTGTQFTITNEFHQSAFIPLFLNGLFLFSYQKKWPLYWLMLFGLVCTREELALLIFAIGVLLFFKKERRKVGLATMVFGVISFILLIYLVIPFFNPQGIYPHFNYGELGKTPEKIMLTILTKPGLFLKNLVSPSIKLKTVFSSFFSFGFLPLFSPAFLIPLGQQFVVRFIDSVTIHRWVNLNHYAIPLSSLLSVASIYGILNLSRQMKRFNSSAARRIPPVSALGDEPPLCRRWSSAATIEASPSLRAGGGFNIKKEKVIKILGILLFIFTVVQNLVFHGPINSLFKKQLYETQPWMRNNYEVLAKIPEGVSLAAQNSLVPHISQRNEIFLLPTINEADYVWVDLADGPNKYAPLSWEETESLVSDLLSSGRYIIFYEQGKSLLLKKR